MVVCSAQTRLGFQVVLMPVGVSKALEITANHGLRFVPFGDLHGLHMALLTHPGIEADEVDVIRALQQQLRHDGVIVVVAIDVAVRTGFGFGFAFGVWVMRRKGLRRKTTRGNRRLLDVNAFAVDVGG